jgi:hypothetical protein
MEEVRVSNFTGGFRREASSLAVRLQTHPTNRLTWLLHSSHASKRFEKAAPLSGLERKLEGPSLSGLEGKLEGSR